ncbi:hypothetical protein KXV31_007127 [Aspergillus fumigatus]|nr:hypothetical protein KXX19_007746 [Aspergillus fumigatus]KAH2028276.1 hypothetical protein KXV65_005744 [Aspergillus fumigatus]KAH2263529.1 hypothetical protein KXW26_005642 [Aspergillus fumigatus]KAH2313780.1 hypothetical protein KXW82_008785 [Aspergillus fumigatus]KAH2589673.1 hypothetical protein KXV63_000416 [Aspergillus fumigatus]
MVLGGPLSKHENEPKRPILLELRSSKVFVIFVVAFATFTDILLYGLIVPVTPTALHERVGLSEDDEQSWTSILLALYGAALLAASPDRIESRRWPLLIGLVALGASTALLCVGTTLGLWIAGRLFQGVAAAVVWTVGLALLVDTIEKEALGEAMGYAAMGITLGTLTGPLLGGVLYENGGYYAVFGLAFGIIGLDIFLRLVLIEKKDALKWLHIGKLSTEPVDNPTQKQPTDGRVSLSGMTDERDSNGRKEHVATSSSTPRGDTIGDANQQMLRKRRFGAVATLLASDRMLVTLWAYFIVAVALTSLDSVLPLFVQDTFGWKQTAQGLIFIPVSVPHVLDPFFGYINDKFPQARRFVVGGALLITIPLFVLLRLVTMNSMSQKVVLCVLLALIGLCLAFLIPPLFVEASYVVQEKEAESPGVFGKGGAMALAYGILNSAFAAGSMVGPFLAGFIRESAGWSTMSWVIGVRRDFDDVLVDQFRGIKYAKIPARFERAQPVQSFHRAVVDATKYGPKCPQVHVDVRHLLRIPEDFEIEPEAEDEFECLNLDITRPPLSGTNGPLPVLVWIYGGSQVVTFCSAQSKICDPTRIVAESIKEGQPFLFVSFNYRLNIFSFGDGKEKNLAIKDQRLAIDWVRENIVEFGGDPNNITLAGESAGAVYVHAHLITGPPVQRAVLASGSLYLSSPLPAERGSVLIKTLESKVQDLGQESLRHSSVECLIRALQECNVNTMWIQEDSEFQDWENKPEQVEELMIGDTEYESVIWRTGIETLDGASITAAFETDKNYGTKLRKMYQVVHDRPTACKLGALDFVNDTRYTLPVELVTDKLRAANKHVFRYVVDQPNPWQSSSRSHHAVDLLFLFGGLDLSFNPAANEVGQEMRKRWIRFVNGMSPWSEDRRFAYGPLGECMEITEAQFASRRRVEHLKALREAGIAAYLPIVFALTAGRISLLN